MDIQLKDSELITDTVRNVNEDIGNIVSNAAWVLDGATSLSDKNITPLKTEAKWYVEKLNHYFENHMMDNSSKELSSIVKESIKKTRLEFFDFLDKEIDEVDEPAASCAMVRWENNILEYFVLCDCTFVLFRNGKVVKKITDDRIDKFEEEIRKKIKHLIEDRRMSLTNARRKVFPIIKKVRRLRNEAGNYWVLSFDPKAVEKAIHDKIELKKGDEVYLFTDGFGRIVDKYSEFEDWQEAIEYINSQGGEKVFSLLRRIEKNDVEGEKYIRTRASDDATLSILKFG